MKLSVSYLDNDIIFEEHCINVIEVENKRYFHRLLTDFCKLSNGLEAEEEEIRFFTKDFTELNYHKKIKLFFNYIDFEFNTKKYTSEIYKLVLSKINNQLRESICKQYNKLESLYIKAIQDLDIPLKIKGENPIETMNKIVGIEICTASNILENLLLLIELEKILCSKNLLIFINLKQYLERDELIELYKYSIYNQVPILLLDSQCYGTTLEYEKKLIIDGNLDEIMI